MKDERNGQYEQRKILQELKGARQLLNQGHIKEALQIVLGLEKSDNNSSRELLSIKLLKADILSDSGEFLEAINCTEDLFQQFQKEKNLLSSFDTLLIQARSLIMLGNISKGEPVVNQAETLLTKILVTIKKIFSI